MLTRLQDLDAPKIECQTVALVPAKMEHQAQRSAGVPYHSSLIIRLDLRHTRMLM
jgi:hypothetical protein